MINLRKGEIRVWLYLSERLCQQVSAELTKAHNVAGAVRLIKPLAHRRAQMLRSVLLQRHLPSMIQIVSEVPNLEGRVPPWLRQVGHQIAAKCEDRYLSR